MTREERESCIGTIELLLRLAFNIHGVMDVIDAENCDKMIKVLKSETAVSYLDGYNDGYKEALKAQPCEDAISRQAVIDITWEEPSYTDALNVLTEVRDKVKDLPPVNPQKSGYWIKEKRIEGWDGHSYQCSVCGRSIHIDSVIEELSDYPYCHCGAKMVEPQESEDKE